MIKDFYKKLFFYNVDKKQKNIIRNEILHDDHRTYSKAVLIIMIIQLFMLFSDIVNTKIDFSDYESYTYPLLHACLALYCGFAYFFIKVAYSKNMTFGYFAICSASMVIIMLWGAAISILDSTHLANITTFAYVTIAAASFIVIEPWIAALNITGVTLVFWLAIYFFPDTRASFGSNLIINSLSVLAISVIVSTGNFYRRIRSFTAKLRINELNQALQAKATIDDLTKLYNRRYLTEHIDTALNVGSRPSGVMLLDLDHFKDLNDTYGHQAGDRFLERVGLIIKSFVLDEENYAVRYGGEEFLIYIAHTTKAELLEQADNLRRGIEEAEDDVLGEVTCTASIGIATATVGLSYAGPINQADNALYTSKQTRNAVTLYK